MCDDLAELLDRLSAKGVEIARPPSDQGWGLLASVRLPSRAEQFIYQPRHLVSPSARLALKAIGRRWPR